MTANIKCDRDGCESPCDYLLDTRLPICASCFQELKAVIPTESAGTDLIARVNDFMSIAKPIMKPAFYVLIIVGGTDPEMAGPFSDETERDATAKIIKNNTLDESDGIFRLNVDSKGRPFVSPYLQGEFEEP